MCDTFETNSNNNNKKLFVNLDDVEFQSDTSGELRRRTQPQLILFAQVSRLKCSLVAKEGQFSAEVETRLEVLDPLLLFRPTSAH